MDTTTMVPVSGRSRSFAFLPSRFVLAAFAAHLGIGRRSDQMNPGPVWDGASLNVDVLVSGSDWAHEIAHWLIAHPALRDVPNFGLGTDWQDGVSPCAMPAAARDRIEGRAAALGIGLLKAVAGDGWEAEVSDVGLMMKTRVVDPTLWAGDVVAARPFVDEFKLWLRTGGRLAA